MHAENSRTIRAHVFSNVEGALFLKHFPDCNPVYQGIEFSFGMDLPADYDVLIVYTRASYSIPTRIPRSRTAFVAAEPDAIHPYSVAFLNQFGIVVTGTDKPLATEKWLTACCTLWFAGIDFSKPFTQEHLVGADWFRALSLPAKERKISVVTSTKNFTPFHRKRLEFIGKLQELIPEHLVSMAVATVRWTTRRMQCSLTPITSQSRTVTAPICGRKSSPIPCCVGPSPSMQAAGTRTSISRPTLWSMSISTIPPPPHAAWSTCCSPTITTELSDP